MKFLKQFLIRTMGDFGDPGPRVSVIGKFPNLTSPVLETLIQLTGKKHFQFSLEVSWVCRVTHKTGLTFDNVFPQGTDIRGEYGKPKAVGQERHATLGNALVG